MGRPTKYKPEMCDLVHKAFLCAKEGLTDKALANLLDVSKATINQWKKEHPEFLDSLKNTKAELNDNVEVSLYQRACGYSHEEEKVFCSSGEIITHKVTKHYPPDTAAAFIWLKNRKSEEWVDVKEQINYHKADEEVSDLEIARRVAYLLTNAVDKSMLKNQ